LSIRSRSRELRLAALCLMAAISVSSAGNARPAGNDAVLARSLFDSGKALMSAGKTDEACDKFAESQRLDPRSGTLLNLAVCREEQGKIATAWLLFQEAIPLSRNDERPDREKLAKDKLAEIEPRLPRLAIEVPFPVDAIEVSLDGVAVGKAAWSEAAPIDPGDHRITVRAPGKKPWSTLVRVGPSADRHVVRVPNLEDDRVAVAPAASSASAPAPRPEPRPVLPERSNTAAYVIGGAGIAALGVGAFFGWRASKKWDDAQSNCTGDVCNAQAESLSREANTAAWVSNVGVGLGLVGIGVATWLLVSAPGDRPHTKAGVQASPIAGTSTLGLGVSGRF